METMLHKAPAPGKDPDYGNEAPLAIVDEALAGLERTDLQCCCDAVEADLVAVIFHKAKVVDLLEHWQASCRMNAGLAMPEAVCVVVGYT